MERTSRSLLLYDGTIIAVPQPISGTISIRIMYDDGDEETATYPDDDVELLAWTEVDVLWRHSTKTLASLVRVLWRSSKQRELDR